MSRNATSHFGNVLESMGHKRWDHRIRLPQLQRALNRLKRNPEFRRKFDEILSPTDQTIHQRDRFKNTLLEKIRNKIETRKRQLLKKFGDDETLKEWWRKMMGWPEQSSLEPQQQLVPQTAESEDRTFQEEVRELARYTRYLNGQTTAADRNERLYDYAMKKAAEIFRKY